jgi:hypothetical protein
MQFLFAKNLNFLRFETALPALIPSYSRITRFTITALSLIILIKYTPGGMPLAFTGRIHAPALLFIVER